ncbi:hypothetical protein I6I57_14035 [Brevibacterium casei]|uniref:Uncharacterized protein n=1 Tax=Brevibacterium ammoniilyticum TaxID=1046555 RepID=A0ABP9U3H7_9MICO|nr:hypothetical protein [Brevibacterium casei]QQT68809.1 hypothetical protein I6I57_14035 [Brevibacterium casei]
MNEERKVIRVLGPKLGDAGWKTVRSALDSWGRTVRLSVLVLVVSTPPLALAWIITGHVM